MAWGPAVRGVGVGTDPPALSGAGGAGGCAVGRLFWAGGGVAGAEAETVGGGSAVTCGSSKPDGPLFATLGGGGEAAAADAGLGCGAGCAVAVRSWPGGVAGAVGIGAVLAGGGWGVLDPAAKGGLGGAVAVDTGPGLGAGCAVAVRSWAGGVAVAAVGVGAVLAGGVWGVFDPVTISGLGDRATAWPPPLGGGGGGVVVVDDAAPVFVGVETVVVDDDVLAGVGAGALASQAFNTC